MLSPLRLLALILTLAACSDDDGGDTTGPALDDLPTAEAACAASCARAEACDVAVEPGCPDVCTDIVAEFVEYNPGTDCGAYEIGRNDCLSRLTCEDFALVQGPPEDRPCKDWYDALDGCERAPTQP